MRFGRYFLPLLFVPVFPQSPAASAGKSKELADLQKQMVLLQRQIRTLETKGIGVDGRGGFAFDLPPGGRTVVDSGAMDATLKLLANTIVLIGGEAIRASLDKNAEGLSAAAVAHQRAQILHDLIAAQKKGAK